MGIFLHLLEYEDASQPPIPSISLFDAMYANEAMKNNSNITKTLKSILSSLTVAIKNLSEIIVENENSIKNGGIFKNVEYNPYFNSEYIDEMFKTKESIIKINDNNNVNIYDLKANGPISFTGLSYGDYLPNEANHINIGELLQISNAKTNLLQGKRASIMKQIAENQSFRDDLSKQIDESINSDILECQKIEELIKKESIDLEKKISAIPVEIKKKSILTSMSRDAGLLKILQSPSHIFQEQRETFEIMVIHEDAAILEFDFQDVQVFPSPSTWSFKTKVNKVYTNPNGNSKVFSLEIIQTNTKQQHQYELQHQQLQLQKYGTQQDNEFPITLVFTCKIRGTELESNLISKPIPYMFPTITTPIEYPTKTTTTTTISMDSGTKNIGSYKNSTVDNDNKNGDLIDLQITDDYSQYMFGAQEFHDSKLKVLQKKKLVKKAIIQAISYPPDIRTGAKNAINYTKIDSNDNSVYHGSIGANKPNFLFGYFKNGGEVLSLAPTESGPAVSFAPAETYGIPDGSKATAFNPGNPNPRNKQGQTPIHLATHYKISYDFLRTILSKRGNPFLKDIFGQTCFHLAVERKHYKMVLEILMAYPSLIYKQNNHGLYPSHFAAMDDTCQMLDIFIAHQLDLIRINNNTHHLQHSPRFISTLCNKQIQKEPLQLQTHPQQQQQRQSPQQQSPRPLQDQQKDQKLHHTQQKQKQKQKPLEFNEKYAPNIFSFVDSSGLTPLHWAASLGLTNSCRKLIEFSNVNQRDYEGETPIFKAIRSSNPSTFHFFYSLPLVDKSIMNYNGMTLDNLLKFRNIPKKDSEISF